MRCLPDTKKKPWAIPQNKSNIKAICFYASLSSVYVYLRDQKKVVFNYFPMHVYELEILSYDMVNYSGIMTRAKNKVLST